MKKCFRWAALPALLLALPLLLAMTPVIDPGHGGFDGGAVAADGTTESELNLAVAKRLELTFLLFGKEPVLLRDRDEALGEGESIRSAKRADLEARVARTDAVADGFLISIHQNSYAASSSHGAQVFWASEESRPFAEELQRICRSIDPGNRREAKPVPGQVYLFRHTRRPAALVECGFLSNPGDLAMLKSEGYQKLLCCGIVSCFLRMTE